VLGSVVESALVLLQFFGRDPFLWFGWRPEMFSSSRMRVYGTLGNPDFVAAWLSAALPLSLVLPGRAWKRAAVVAFELAAILATGSRVFLLALPAAAAAALLCSVRPRKWWLAGLPVAAALLWLSPARTLQATVEGRLYLARVTAAHWREVPLTGFGPGSFPLKFAAWQLQWLRSQGPGAGRFAGAANHAHNDYLELWVEYGPIGLGAFLVLSGWLIAGAWKKRSENPAALCALAALLAIACVDFPLHRPAECGLYWLLLGMLSGPGALMERRTEECRSR
jgi:putative inorganic carbon (HCO3(-)) transporter